MAEIDDFARGALQEIGNIGMGHMATALSNMIDRDVKIDIPIVEIQSLKQIIANASEGPQKIVMGIHLEITGDVNGGTLILLPKFSAFSFADLLLKKPTGTTRSLEVVETNKLREMGVRLCGAYMRAVNEFLGITLSVGEPEIAVNMDGVDEFINEQINKMADEFIVVKGECVVPATNSKNKFNLLFEPDASDIILAAVMKKMMG